MKKQLLTISVIALLSIGQTAMASPGNELFPFSEDSPSITLSGAPTAQHATVATLGSDLFPSDEDVTHRSNASYQTLAGVGSIKASMMETMHSYDDSSNINLFSVDYLSPE